MNKNKNKKELKKNPHQTVTIFNPAKAERGEKAGEES